MEMQGGFSIREYVSRMRSINVVNCWPFDETSAEETVKSLLPPIVVKRFTWWLDELEFLNSETTDKFKISERKTRNVFEKGETSLRNVERDSEGGEEGVMVKLKSIKGKMRATKKRSIVEIFAVAPPVKRAISVEDEEADEEDAANEGINRATKSKKKKMKNKAVILRKALRVVKKIKRKKAAEKRGGGGIGVPDKLFQENFLKLKLQTRENATGNSSSSCSSEESEDNIRDCPSIPKRKPRLKDSGLYKKLMTNKAFKLIEENQHPGLCVRGILKNEKRKELSLKQSKKCILQKAIQLNNCSSQKANKHVTFLENDELRKPSQSADCSKLQRSDFVSGIGSADYADALRKYSTISETSGSEDASTRTRREIGAGPASNEQLTMFSVSSTTLGKQNYKGEHSTRYGSSERSAAYSVDQHWSDHDLGDGLYMARDGYYSSQNVKVITASSNSTCRRLNKDLGTPRPIFPPRCFEDYQGTHNDTPVSHLSNVRRTYELTQDSSENTAINCVHSVHVQTYPHLSPNELLQNFYSLPDGPTGDICGRSKNGINEEFVGLPLNSQGELIMLNSSAKREVNQMINSNVSTAHCIGLSLPNNSASKCLCHHSVFRNLDSRTSSTGQLNLFPMESYVKENAIAVIPSRLGIIESQSEKANLDIDFPQINYHSFHNSEKTVYRSNDQVQKGPENEKFHAKMRLMGKEFEVGGRGVQGFEDGRMWKDKKIIDELHFQNDSINSVVFNQNEPSFEDSRETLLSPSELTVNHRSESKYALPLFDRQTGSTYKSVFLTRTVDCPQKLYPSLSPATYSEVHNSNSLFSEPFTTGYGSQLFALELPKATAPHQELYSNMSPSTVQLKNKQNLHYSPISAIKFPFMHPDLDEHASSTWARRSLSQNPSCFDVSEKASSQGRNVPYPQYLQPDDYYSAFRTLSSGSALQSMAPTPLTPAPYYPEVVPVPAMQRKHGNHNRIKERIKSRVGIRGFDTCKKPRSSAPFKPLKRSPPVHFHEGLHCAAREPAARVSFGHGVRNMEDSFGSCSATKNPRFVMAAEYDEEQTILPWVGAGPLKLSGGVKHVLKARLQKDQSSSRSTDEDISLSATNIGFTI